MAVDEENRRLRQMADAVISGTMPRDEYRRERRAIIDRLAGEASVRPPGAPDDIADVTSPNLPRVELPAASRGGAPVAVRLTDPATDRAGGRSDLVLGIGVVAIVLLVVAAVLAFFW